jgi:hypothetical protein
MHLIADRHAFLSCITVQYSRVETHLPSRHIWKKKEGGRSACGFVSEDDGMDGMDEIG